MSSVSRGIRIGNIQVLEYIVTTHKFCIINIKNRINRVFSTFITLLRVFFIEIRVFYIRSTGRLILDYKFKVRLIFFFFFFFTFYPQIYFLSDKLQCIIESFVFFESQLSGKLR